MGNKVFIFDNYLAQEGPGVLNLKLSDYLKPYKSGQKEVQALAEAYSEQIEKIKIQDGDWAILLNGTWFYWRGGRLLPESILEDEEKYSPYKFYRYPLELPDEMKTPSQKTINRRKKMRRTPVNTSFFNELYGGTSYREIRRHIKTIRFLGYRMDAHENIVPVLRLVEEEIEKLQREDGAVKNLLKNLQNIECFSWRGVMSSMSRSFHSYGIAVDLIPAFTAKKPIYWAWLQYHNDRWYEIPYEDRWMVPDKIVSIFEKHGFVWGGKWLFFDNMHFEYRPELLLLAGEEVNFPPHK
ncbi:MAG: M15 family metallopeptidase [Elusimicrobiota bacterium]